MTEALFAFLQVELPWSLGPADGRYVLRGDERQVQHIVVLATLGAPRRQRLSRGRPRKIEQAEPAPVTTARATVIDAAPLGDEPAGRAWLAAVQPDASIRGALGVLNRLLFTHRLASADPSVHEVSAAQALVIRAGWGEGERVADGRWREAVELVLPAQRRNRTAALRPQERLAVVLGGRGSALLGEELVLRARADVDQGRLGHAALELRDAYATTLAELAAEPGVDLGERLGELRELQPGVEAAARAVLASPAQPPADPQGLRHALVRLEAALRARTAGGFGGA